MRTAQASKLSDLDAILAWIGDAHADVDKAAATLKLLELAEGVTLDQLRERTEARFVA